MKVAIAGAGNVGMFIADDLVANGHQVLLIEQDHAIAERAARAERSAGIEWHVADACEVSELRAAGLTPDPITAVADPVLGAIRRARSLALPETSNGGA